LTQNARERAVLLNRAAALSEATMLRRDTPMAGDRAGRNAADSPGGMSVRISLTLDDELGHDLDAAAAGGNRSARVGLRLRTHVTFSPTVAESRGNGRLARLLHSHRGSAEPTRSDVGDNGVVTVREPQHHPIIVLNATPNWHLPYRCSAGQAKRLTPS